jgi:asparagine synthase (glutamine-hydrolysing)
MRGADPERVRAAVESGDPLPGTRGFAGPLDGGFVRDVLGRVPIYTERADPTTWAFDPTDLGDPDPVPAGHRRTSDGDERLWSLPELGQFPDRRTAVSAVRQAVTASVDSVNEQGLAVAFSGGLDSAILATRLDAPLYVAGFPESHDVAAARSAATLLERDLTVVELSPERLEAAVPKVARATGRTNAMDTQIALPLFLVAERAAADGYDRLAVGQGADELFGGYAKVERAPTDPRVAADTVRGARDEMVATLPDQLGRDTLALGGAGVEPVAPLLDDRVVRAALSLPGDMLVSARGERKWALRLAARGSVPDGIAFREKKAVQYGSGVARELDRLARQAGFKRRQDDHVGRYVAARLEEGPG